MRDSLNLKNRSFFIAMSLSLHSTYIVSSFLSLAHCLFFLFGTGRDYLLISLLKKYFVVVVFLGGLVLWIVVVVLGCFWVGTG